MDLISQFIGNFFNKYENLVSKLVFFGAFLLIMLGNSVMFIINTYLFRIPIVNKAYQIVKAELDRRTKMKKKIEDEGNIVGDKLKESTKILTKVLSMMSKFNPYVITIKIVLLVVDIIIVLSSFVLLFVVIKPAYSKVIELGDISDYSNIIFENETFSFFDDSFEREGRYRWYQKIFSNDTIYHKNMLVFEDDYLMDNNLNHTNPKKLTVLQIGNREIKLNLKGNVDPRTGIEVYQSPDSGKWIVKFPCNKCSGSLCKFNNGVCTYTLSNEVKTDQDACNCNGGVLYCSGKCNSVNNVGITISTWEEREVKLFRFKSNPRLRTTLRCKGASGAGDKQWSTNNVFYYEMERTCDMSSDCFQCSKIFGKSYHHAMIDADVDFVWVKHIYNPSVIFYKSELYSNVVFSSYPSIGGCLNEAIIIDGRAICVNNFQLPEFFVL
jgi:hypothetical protein